MRNIQATGTLYGETITVKQINKTEARNLFNKGEVIYMQSSNLMPFGVWQPLFDVSKYESEYSFDSTCNSFEYYNCDNERGYYANFYKRIS